jgi:hypothetical protein
MANLNEILGQFCTKYTEVQTTTNYNLFGFIKGNREINDGNLNNIKESSTKKQILESAIIVGFDADDFHGVYFKIIEGQHRFTAWKELGLPISFVIRKDFDMHDYEKSIADIQLLNTANKEWDTTNFMGSRAALGEVPYILYKDLYEKYQRETDIGFEHEIFFYILNNKNVDRKKTNHNTFKAGHLEFTQQDYNYVDGILSDLSSYLPKVLKYGKRYYLKAIVDVLNTENVDRERLYKKMEKVIDLPFSKDKTFSLKHVVEKIYNDSLKQNKIWIYTAGNNEIHLQVK